MNSDERITTKIVLRFDNMNSSPASAIYPNKKSPVPTHLNYQQGYWQHDVQNQNDDLCNTSGFFAILPPLVPEKNKLSNEHTPILYDD